MPKIKLETIGKVITAGFSDRVIIGIITGYLSKSTPKSCYEWIRDNRSLLEGISDRNWARYRKLARGANIDLTTDSVISQLRKDRPDLLSVILNTPDGLQWLDNQIAQMKKKLGSD